MAEVFDRPAAATSSPVDVTMLHASCIVMASYHHHGRQRLLAGNIFVEQPWRATKYEEVYLS